MIPDPLGPVADPRRLRVAIVGANGRLGRAIEKRLGDEATVVPLTRAEVDLACPGEIPDRLSAFDFDVLVLTAALTAVDYCEDHPEEAHAINAMAPGVIARACRDKGARMVHFSTDFVFDGQKRGAYGEDDTVGPKSVYGSSKLEGERQVLEVSEDHLVIRVAWLYGAAKPAFPEWIIRQAVDHEALALPSDKTGSPTCSEDVADGLARLLGGPGGLKAAGVLHLCNSGSCTWQEWGQYCLDTAAEAGLELRARTVGANRLADVAAFVAPRPECSVLDTARYQRLTGVSPRHWQDALREHLMGSELLATPRGGSSPA